MASKPKTIRQGAFSRTEAKLVRVRAPLRRAALPGAAVAGLAWVVVSLFAPAPAPRAATGSSAQHTHLFDTTAVAPAQFSRLPASSPVAAAMDAADASTAVKTARLADPTPGKSGRHAATPVADAEDPFDAVVRQAALTPQRLRIVFQSAYLADMMQVARNEPAPVEPAVASAAGETQPEASPDVVVAALTPANVPLPQSRPRLTDVAVPDKPEKPAAAVATARPEKPVAEKPAGLLAGLFAASPEQPAKPEKPAKTLKPAKPGKPEVAMAAMAFARPDSPDRGMTSAFNGLFNKPKVGNGVAVYDISAGVVIMPDGERLEAHSGIGKMADNPRFVHVKMNGPTPPNTYKLSMREKRFHGVEAIRMTPVGEEPMHGRTGILAHSYLLRGRTGQSHGCVAFANYPRFLKAFKEGRVTHIVVIPGNARTGAPQERVAANNV